MVTYRITDNNCGNDQVTSSSCQENLRKIGNKSLSDLEKENPDLLIFPSSLEKTEDQIEDQRLFSIDENGKLTTKNMMGFIGRNETQLNISSRFYPDENDYFLHFLLQKVFSINLLDLKFSTTEENVWDIFLIYLYPYYLKKAVGQGLYKEYVRKNHNDSNVKGAIDINRHIRENIPFRGSISYTTREYTFDNNMTQLIRHTQEFIKNRGYTSVLNCDKEMREATNLITYNTNSYSKLNRQKIIQNNRKRLNHPHYTEYETLRKICLQILRQEGLSYGKEKDKVYGIVFDGAWLWEEYLNTILKKVNFSHPENKTKTNGIPLFKDKKILRFPDFYSKEQSIVLDPKYKKFEDWNPNGENNLDVYQIITYLHCLNSQLGGLVFPFKYETKSETIGQLHGYGGKLFKIGFHIPIVASNFSRFSEMIGVSETGFIKLISDLN